MTPCTASPVKYPSIRTHWPVGMSLLKLLLCANAELRNHGFPLPSIQMSAACVAPEFTRITA